MLRCPAFDRSIAQHALTRVSSLLVCMCALVAVLCVQVAHFTHRTAVIPDVPCGAPWLHSEKAWGQAKCRAPLNILDERYR